MQKIVQAILFGFVAPASAFSIWPCGSLIGDFTADAPDGYDQEKAELLERYSAASYCKQEVGKWEEDCSICQNDLQTGFTVTAAHLYHEVNTKFFAGHDGESIILVFRGTDMDPNDIISWNLYDFTEDAFLNWKSNMNTIPVPYQFDPEPYGFSDSNVEVHQGFQHAYQSLRSEVRAAIQSLRQTHPSFPLYVTGHSLGGAIAQHAALDLAVNDGEHPIVYTYGSPRLGKVAWADYYEQHVTKSFRVVQNSDVVPRLAPAVMGFEHAGKEIWYQKVDNDWWAFGLTGWHYERRFCEGREDQCCSTRYEKWSGFNPIDGIREHTAYLTDTYMLTIGMCPA